MKLLTIIVLNVGLIGFFVYLLRKRNLLSYFEGGKWWLTWLSIAIITLMDELTSVFYVAGESYLVVGFAAFVFIVITSIFMRFLSNRMVEIAHILENNGIRGGGVYSFSYMVLGPTVSFIAVASIIVDYVLTAAISTVSAVYNGGSFFDLGPVTTYALMLGIIWFVAGLNIIGIKENARFTFFIFVAAALILLTLIVSALIDPSPGQGAMVVRGVHETWNGITGNGFWSGTGFMIFGIASVILAYSGIESVVQTAGLVKSWKEIRKAYLFLALTVGIVTPLITTLVLTRTDIQFKGHETDLITYFGTVLNGKMFGVMVAALASFTLIMAVNTAFVASSELLERVAHRYGFHWIIKTNKRDSLYRIHIISAILYSLIIIITAGSQEVLAHMYAVGLVASFTINMGALVYYRYSKGSEGIKEYHTSRTGTLFIFIILLCVFVFIAIHKYEGVILWGISVILFLIIGLRVAKRRAPEIVHLQKTDNPMTLIFQCAETEDQMHHIYFLRPKDHEHILHDPSVSYVTFYNPRAGAPEKVGPNHYVFPLQAATLIARIKALMHLLHYELPGKPITFHFGWPTTSWVDRMSIGVMVLSLVRLPRAFPNYSFVMEHEGNTSLQPIGG